MNTTDTPAAAFEEDPPRLPAHTDQPLSDPDMLLLNIDGYEGPLDVLLDLARSQKVDLAKISILQLVKQYLAFIDRAKTLNLELAAEYLVMAAWLTYLKSRLLLPREEEDSQHSAEDMAEALQFQLRRLEAIQNAACALQDRPHLGVDIFARGAPEALSLKTRIVWQADIVSLMKAYGAIKKRSRSEKGYDLPVFELLSAERALERVERMLGQLPRGERGTVWTTLDSFLPDRKPTHKPLYMRSSLASTLTVMLELAKQGRIEVKQDGLFRPVYMRGLATRDHPLTQPADTASTDPNASVPSSTQKDVYAS